MFDSTSLWFYFSLTTMTYSSCFLSLPWSLLTLTTNLFTLIHHHIFFFFSLSPPWLIHNHTHLLLLLSLTTMTYSTSPSLPSHFLLLLYFPLTTITSSSFSLSHYHKLFYFTLNLSQTLLLTPLHTSHTIDTSSFFFKIDNSSMLQSFYRDCESLDQCLRTLSVRLEREQLDPA